MLKLSTVWAGCASPWRCLTFSIFLVLSITALSCEEHAGIRGNIRALEEVTLLRDAEAMFYVEHGRYADLVSLGPISTRLTSSELAAGVAKGYRYQVELSDSGYRIVAWPVVRGEAGLASYYCDQTGVIRRSWGPT